MTGGFAYVLDETGEFVASRCNRNSVDLEAVIDPDEVEMLRSLVFRHFETTASPRAKSVLENWEELLPKFVKVFPLELKAVQAQRTAIHG
jgi:glutamate synthase domain-containing protein 3